MNYFLKQQGQMVLGGSFTIDQINEQIQSGILNSETLATADLGESASQIENAPDRDWIYLAGVPGINGLGMPPKGVVGRPPVFGVFSITAPFWGGVLAVFLTWLTQNIFSLLLTFPLSLVCGLILAFVAWSRGERYVGLGWFGLSFNSAVLLYLIFRGHYFSIGC